MKKTIKTITGIDNIYAIMKECGNDFYDQTFNNEKNIRNLSEKFDKYGNFLVALIDEKIVGFIAFYDNNTTDFIAFVSMIIVKSNCQHQGIGNFLLSEMIHICQKKEMLYIRAEIANSNQQSISFFRKHQFILEKSNEKTSYYIMQLKKRDYND